MQAFSQALLFTLACNLDTVLAAVGLGTGGPSHRRSDFAVAALTTLVTLLSLLLGARGAAHLSPALADKLGSLALIALGVWYLLKSLSGPETGAPAPGGDWLSLSAALAVNNAGVGVAAGATGLDPALCAGCNFLVTLAALALGRHLGSRLARWSALALPLSGLLLALLGLARLPG